MTDSIDSFLDQWSAAEQAGDTERLDALLADDFAGIGPVGFTLPKQAWLARHRSGDLRYDSFALVEVQIRGVRPGRGGHRPEQHPRPLPGPPDPRSHPRHPSPGQRSRHLAARRHPHELHRRHSRRATHPRRCRA